MKRKNSDVSHQKGPSKKKRKRKKKNPSFRKQAFPINLTPKGWKPKDWSVPISSPEEFLRRVHHESKNLNQIVFSKEIREKEKENRIKKTEQSKNDDENKVVIIKKNDENFVSIVNNFSNLREMTEKEIENEKINPSHYELDDETFKLLPIDKNNWNKWRIVCENNRPTTKMIMNIDYLERNELFKKVINWVIDVNKEKENYCVIINNLYRWIFSLMLFIEKPLLSSIAAQMNSLVDWIKSNSDNENSKDSKMILCIISDYFKQKGLGKV